MRTLRFLLEKEFRQFVRNPFLPRLVVIFPLVVMLLMPMVMTMDVKHIAVTVVDHDRSDASRRLITKVRASDYFTLKGVSDDYNASLRAMEAGNADVIIEIPDRFERGLMEGSPEKISIVANGVDALKGSIGSQYMTRLIAQTLSELSAEQGLQAQPDVMSSRNLYNPTLDYRRFMIPALMIMLLVIICGFMPALNLVSEKEIGTIEQINVTPVSRLTFTLAKLMPFWIIGFVVLTIAMLVAWAIYGLTPAGNIGAIYLAALLFILPMSGIGVIVANYSSTMQQTMFVMFFFVMIFVLMSGLVTPVSSMPAWAETLTRVIPPRYFVDTMRSVYLKGSTVADLWTGYASLAGFALVFNTAAALSYRKRA